MDKEIIKRIANELNIGVDQVSNTLKLLEEGSTVPFIARYRKEMTKGLDEEQIRVIQEEYNYQVNLQKRKEEVINRIETLGKLTDTIKKQVLECTKLSQVEDIYRPYKQKKKTRASVAIANGMKPLADLLLKSPRHFEEKDVETYLNDKVTNIQEALQQAKDIIAEMVSDDHDIRNKIYDSMMNYGRIVTKEKKEHDDQAKVYRMYYDRVEKVSHLASHRIMAIDRAEKEKVINVQIEFNEEYIENFVKRRYVRYPNSPCAVYVNEAIVDGLKRLAYPSVERMVRSELSAKAHESSIDVFSMNLEKLLLQAPIKNKRILGFDPAFRTGCKLAVIDESGKMLCVDVIYPHQPNAKIKEAKTKLVKLIKDYDESIIAIGNGTASRESETFVSNVISEYGLNVQYTIVSEAGASVYSASKLAIEEFPNLHVEQRSAISIARRLMDPLSELIKIDPQSIGVGQYQHDMNQKKLGEALTGVVEDSVNKVGVDLNTASASLLEYISGVSKAIAKNIVAYREENGRFTSRKELLKVAKLGPKAFEQCAGFMRITGGSNPLDATSVHPESYEAASKLLEKLGYSAEDIAGSRLAGLSRQIGDYKKTAAELKIGEITLRDIVKELEKPARDPRDEMPKPILRTDVLDIKDLKEGMILKGTVRNVIDFGAFVDIGVHQDGLVHISQMSEKFIKHPLEAVSVGDVVEVRVLGVDEKKNRISLSMKGLNK